MDFRGDPASALLEVLDPEQNVIVPRSLRRRGVRSVAGPVHHDGERARHGAAGAARPDGDHRARRLHRGGEGRHREAAPRAEAGAGARARSRARHRVHREALRLLVRGYTREAGVRNLEREIASVCRKVARRRVEGQTEPVAGDAGRGHVVPGRAAVRATRSSRSARGCPGVAIGLAWTPAGGDILFIEATRMTGQQTLTLTGQLGDVMKESAQAALSWVRSHAERARHPRRTSGRRRTSTSTCRPGAIPKDGPSAGVTMVTALVSLLTQRAGAVRAWP